VVTKTLAHQKGVSVCVYLRQEFHKATVTLACVTNSDAFPSVLCDRLLAVSPTRLSSQPSNAQSARLKTFLLKIFLPLNICSSHSHP
jgi:hypothetical protein